MGRVSGTVSLQNRVLWSTADAFDGDKWRGQSSQETECSRKFNCITVDNHAPSAEPIRESEKVAECDKGLYTRCVDADLSNQTPRVKNRRKNWEFIPGP